MHSSQNYVPQSQYTFGILEIENIITKVLTRNAYLSHSIQNVQLRHQHCSPHTLGMNQIARVPPGVLSARVCFPQFQA